MKENGRRRGDHRSREGDHRMRSSDHGRMGGLPWWVTWGGHREWRGDHGKRRGDPRRRVAHRSVKGNHKERNDHWKLPILTCLGEKLKLVDLIRSKFGDAGGLQIVNVVTMCTYLYIELSVL